MQAITPRKLKAVVFFLAAVILGTSGTALWVYLSSQKPFAYRVPRTLTKQILSGSFLPLNQKPKTKALYYCPLCGVQTSKEKSHRRPLAIMIENHPRARPQSGLVRACIVYEVPAEGGITRFLALFGHNDAEELGPIRSARPYFIDLSLEYNSVYVHCGQSWQAFERIYTLNLPTINEMWRPESFWRNRSRYAPHNLYTSTEKLRKVVARKQWEKPHAQSHFSFHRGNITRDASSPASAFSLQYPLGDRVSYRYDAAKQVYMRFVNGKPHVDKNPQSQIFAKTVMVLSIPAHTMDEEGRQWIDVVGEGKASFFAGGKVIEGSWLKRSLYEPASYYDVIGNPLKFPPGPVWILIAPLESTLKVFP